MSRRAVPGALVLALALGLAPLAAQPAFQVKDIKTSVSPDLPVSRTDIAKLSGITYFTASDEIHGFELWRSDATAAGTSMVVDLCPGSCGGASHPVVASGQLYFYGYDGEAGTLYRSDGTAAGTVPVFPPFSTLGQKGLVPFAELGGNLLLLVNNVALGQLELWQSDGTAAGTSLLKSIGPFPAMFPVGPILLGSTGSTLFFSYDDGSHGRELWKTDGTPAGTGLVLDIAAGSASGIRATFVDPGPQNLPLVSGALLFIGCDADHGCELWKSDGTAAGTSRVADLAPGAADAGISHLSAWNGEAVFLAVDGLWKSDGTAAGTVRIGPVLPPASSTTLGELAVAGSRIFFSGCFPDCGLWTSDGTAAGTVRVADLSPISHGGPGTYTNVLTAAGDRVVYWNDDGTHGLEPWGSDGTPGGTALLADIVPGANGSFPFFGQDALILTAGSSWLIPALCTTGWELWGSDGTAAGTALLQPLNTQASSLSPYFFYPELLDLGGTLLFTPNGAGASALWKTDGTDPGTGPVGHVGSAGLLTPFGGKAFFIQGLDVWTSDGTDAGTGVFYHDPANSVINLTRWGDRLYFALLSVENNQDNIQIWKSDGTAAGTVLVKKIVPAFFPNSGITLAPANDRLYFSINGLEFADLWVSDGTEAGTLPIREIQAAYPVLPALRTVGSRLFFTDRNSTELWESDGTPAGTLKLATLQARLTQSADFGGRLFFAADDGVHGWEPWSTDGTPAGTHMVADLLPGTAGSLRFSFPLVSLFHRAYFAATDGVHGQELWTSDGTAAGTHMVADILPGAGSSVPTGLTAVGHLLFFAAADGVHGTELWTSDGTQSGTRMVQDIAPGALPASPYAFIASGPYLYFAADDGTHGFEPWALPRAGLGGFLTATLSVVGQTWETGTVTYTLTVTNVGAGPALDNPGDEVSDVLPAGLTLLSAMAGSGTVTTDLPGNRVAWNGALDPGAAVTITIQAHVSAGTFGSPLANQATLAFDANGDGSNESSGTSDDPNRPGLSDATLFTPATSPLAFYSLPPCRVLDTRGGTPLASGVARTLGIAGTCGIPADARAVAANLTVVNPSAAGFLTVYPTGTAAPLASTLNFARFQTRTNNAVLPLSGGQLDATAGLPGGGQTDLVIDVVGYFR